MWKNDTVVRRDTATAGIEVVNYQDRRALIDGLLSVIDTVDDFVDDDDDDRKFLPAAAAAADIRYSYCHRNGRKSTSNSKTKVNTILHFKLLWVVY